MSPLINSASFKETHEIVYVCGFIYKELAGCVKVCKLGRLNLSHLLSFFLLYLSSYIALSLLVIRVVGCSREEARMKWSELQDHLKKGPKQKEDD